MGILLPKNQEVADPLDVFDDAPAAAPPLSMVMASMNYPGGKNGYGSYQRIISQIPEHSVYVEPFAGSAAVYRHKKPSEISLLIDKDPVAPCHHFPELVGLVVMCEDGIDWLADDGPGYSGNTFVYCDPPYLLSTRNSKRPLYNCEMSSVEHRRLLSIIKQLACPVAISGYMSEMYSRELQGWRVISWSSKTRGNKESTEYLWMNYPEPNRLHDYRYLGEDYRDRERIRKKARRWNLNIDNMPRDDRMAVMAAIRGEL